MKQHRRSGDWCLAITQIISFFMFAFVIFAFTGGAIDWIAEYHFEKFKYFLLFVIFIVVFFIAAIVLKRLHACEEKTEDTDKKTTKS